MVRSACSAERRPRISSAVRACSASSNLFDRSTNVSRTSASVRVHSTPIDAGSSMEVKAEASLGSAWQSRSSWRRASLERRRLPVKNDIHGGADSSMASVKQPNRTHQDDAQVLKSANDAAPAATASAAAVPSRVALEWIMSKGAVSGATWNPIKSRTNQRGCPKPMRVRAGISRPAGLPARTAPSPTLGTIRSTGLTLPVARRKLMHGAGGIKSQSLNSGNRR